MLYFGLVDLLVRRAPLCGPRLSSFDTSAKTNNKQSRPE